MEAELRRVTLTADLLPGVPLIESPFFEEDVTALAPEHQDVARQLHARGYAVLDFPDPEFPGKADAIRKRLTARFNWGDPASCPPSARVQDAWEFDAEVRDIACNASILALLSALYGRQAFPFQTLNFPVGTRQPVHSDHIHFCSIPERFMCGVWVAMEDVHADAGPLFYYPGSHVWPSYGNAHIGATPGADAVMKFIRLQQEMPARLGVERETFIARKGQALIWASNLLHGGSAQNDPTRSRWSQVTHYFFEGCRYTTPLHNDELAGKIIRRRVKDARKGGGFAALVDAGRALFSKNRLG